MDDGDNLNDSGGDVLFQQDPHVSGHQNNSNHVGQREQTDQKGVNFRELLEKDPHYLLDAEVFMPFSYANATLDKDELESTTDQD